jgi:hypothetical protein
MITIVKEISIKDNMSLVICEGLDRVGKTSVAELFKFRGFEVVHMSAPSKGQTEDNFLEEMMEIVQKAAHSDIFLDRSYYGEHSVWPQVYGRKSLLSDESLAYLRELEESVDTTRILMYDPDSKAHWQRCVDNNEPLTQQQFVKARALFSSMADKYDFVRKTIKDFPDAVQPLPNNQGNKPAAVSQERSEASEPVSETRSDKTPSGLAKTKEQLKLERANILNEVLSKRIIKGKGPMFDEIERNVRHFLNQELGKILGTTSQAPGFSNEEIELLRFFCKRLKEKEN